MRLSRQNLWISTKDYIFIIFGMAMYGFGFAAFINPEGVITGGMAGIGQVVFYTSQKLLGFGIPVAVTMYALNILLLIIAYHSVGRTFVVRTIFGVTMISIFVGMMVPLFPQPIVNNEPFMNIIIGSILCGAGIGLAFAHNGSSGGTDIVAAIVSKRSNVSIGRMMQCIDFCIISSSLLIFGLQNGVDKLVYGIVVLLIVSIMADQVINTNRQAVQFIIFSPKWEEIATAINNDAHRGCTVIDGMGWYSKQEVKILLVMCRKIESVTVYRIIKSIDNNAFITQANVNGVYGQGFDELKLKMKKPTQHPDTAIPAHKRPVYDTDKTTSSPHPERMA